MIKFSLFGFPIRIQWIFWLLCAFLGSSALTDGGREGIILFVSWVAIVLVSIIWHELGHAFARKHYGAPYSEIVLHGFGGYCAGPGNFTRKQSMWISFAGPLYNFMIGGLIYLLVYFTDVETTQLGARIVGAALFVNVGWAILNLLPIYPLDGGQIFAAMMANKKPSIVPIVGMVCAGLLAVFGIMNRQIWMAFIFGLLAYQNWQRSQGQSPNRFF